MLDFHQATPEEKRAAFAAVHGIWPHADDPEVHLLKRLQSVQHARADWFVGTAGQEVVVSCGAYPLRLFGPNGERACRGFGAVYTQADHRGKGHAAELMRFVMDYYRIQAVQDFLLFSDIDPRYYERLGFHRLPSQQWRIEAKALAPEASWALKRTKVLADDPGPMACDYGLSRTGDDNVWILARQGLPLRKTLVLDHRRHPIYWILSYRQGQTYHFLESNIPQDRHHWDLFEILVGADCHKAKCKNAVGWWTAADAQNLPSPVISSRQDGILMWASSHGESDPWLPSIVQRGFRTFISEQF